MTGAPTEPATGPLQQAGALTPVPPSHHGHNLARWPLRDALTLGALNGAVPSARVHVRQLLWEWGHSELEEQASIVTSELVTNAVNASVGLRPAIPPVLVWLGSDNRRLLLAVADASNRRPVRLDLSPDAEGGRGLMLVEALSNVWGWYHTTMAGLVKVVCVDWHLNSFIS